MSFATLLSLLKRSTKVAKKCADGFTADTHSGAICCAEFINDCFKVIGCSLRINWEELQLDVESFNWSTNRWLYTYTYHKEKQELFEKFLKNFCYRMLALQEEHERERTCQNDEVVDKLPLDRLLMLIGKWLQVCESLLNFQEDENEERNQRIARNNLKEPLARINLAFLLGIQTARMKYSNEKPELHVYNKKLVKSAIEGAAYENSQSKIASSLIQLFEDNFDYYIEDAIHLYTAIQAHEPRRHVFIMVMRHFQNMLEQSVQCTPQQPPEGTFHTMATQNRLVNYLIGAESIKALYTYLRGINNKRMIFALLNMLEVLQAKLVSVEVLPKQFLEAILMKCIEGDIKIKSCAANVYFKIMTRRFHNPFIFKSTLDFAYKYISQAELLPEFALLISENKLFMRSPKLIFHLIVNSANNRQLQLFVSHYFVPILRRMCQNFAMHLADINWILNAVPTFLTSLKENDPLADTMVLWLGEINFQRFVNTFKVDCGANGLQHTTESESCLNTVRRLQQTMFNIFANDRIEDPEYIINIFAVLTSCLIVTNEWRKLQDLAVLLVERFKKLHAEFHVRNVVVDEEAGRIPKVNYTIVIQKLATLMPTDFGLKCDFAGLVNAVGCRHLNRNSQEEINMNTDSLIEMYSDRLLAAGLVRLYVELKRDTISSIIPQLAGKLSKFYINLLIENSNENPNLRLYFAFMWLLALYSYETSIGEVNIMDMDQQTYIRITNILSSMLNESSESIMADAKSKIYKSLMLQRYVALLESEKIDITSHCAWKIGIFLGKNNKAFDAEIKLVLRTLAEKNFSLYRNCMYSVVYNLPNNNQADFKYDLGKLLKEHLTLLHEEHSVNANALKVDIAINVMEMVRVHLRVSLPSPNKNRIRIFNVLFILLENIRVAKIVFDEILNLITIISEFNLNANEKKSLKNFADKVNAMPVRSNDVGVPAVCSSV